MEIESNLLGIDIGGTKCAVIYGVQKNENLMLVDKKDLQQQMWMKLLKLFCPGLKR